MCVAGGVSLLITQMAPQAAQASVLPGLITAARQCLQSGREPLCHKALRDAEILQRRAAAARRNQCQSMALGLQADVLMIQLGQGRGAQAFTTLRDVEIVCRGL